MAETKKAAEAKAAKAAEAKSEKAAEAPEPTEPKAVEVSPEETPTASFFGKEYVVTSDGGHRLKG